MAENVTKNGSAVKSKFYQQILKEKSNIEGQFIFSIFKNTNYFYDYEVSVSDFSERSWAFYYRMLQDLVGTRKLKVIDAVSVGAYVDTKNELFQKTYKQYGGFDTIRKGINIMEEDNIESYYSELQRYKTVVRLLDRGFPIEEKWEAYRKLPLEDFEEVLEAQVSEAFIDTQLENDKVVDLFDDIEGMIKRADEGEVAGLPLQSELMESIQNGLSCGNITMLAASSGVGKTFLTTMIHLMSSLANREPVLVIANEEEKDRYLQAMMTSYINLHHKGAEFNKSRFITGGFSERELFYLNEAKDWFNQNVEEGLIRFVNMTSFSMAKTIRLIKKYARIYGIKYFILDTLKMDNDIGSRVTDNSWLVMQQNMVKLYNVIKPANLNVHVWVTAQMAKSNRRARYLDQSMIGMAKNITDVVSSLMLVRMVSLSEKDPEKGIQVIDRNGNKKLLEEDKDYMIVFWDKNRQGQTNRQVVLEVDRGLNIVRDTGITQIDNELE